MGGRGASSSDNSIKAVRISFKDNTETTYRTQKNGYISDINGDNYQKTNRSINIRGVISLMLGIISIIMCFNFLLMDISNVGMYTKVFERLYYAFNLVMAPLFLSVITLIISYSGKDSDKALNKTGLFLSIISLLIVTLEIVIVIIY